MGWGTSEVPNTWVRMGPNASNAASNVVRLMLAPP